MGAYILVQCIIWQIPQEAAITTFEQGSVTGDPLVPCLHAGMAQPEISFIIIGGSIHPTPALCCGAVRCGLTRPRINHHDWADITARRRIGKSGTNDAAADYDHGIGLGHCVITTQ